MIVPPTGILDVRHVINYDLPIRIETYINNIILIANWGKGSSFYDAEQDLALSGDFVQYLGIVNQQVPAFLNDNMAPQQNDDDENDEW